MPKSIPFAPLLALFLLVPAIAGAGSPFEGDRWPRAEPEERGLDAELLGRLQRDIASGGRFPDLHSLLIVKDGRLVMEEYFAGWSPERLHTLQSVTKSFTSALVGIAIGRGELRGVDEAVLGFFAGLEIAHLDDRKRALRVEDLLTMRSGTDYHERGSNSPHDQLNRRRTGWDRFYLDRPMVTDPGRRFQYDSGGVILLSSLIERRTGLHADAYADLHLFGPLGIDRAEWFRNDEGHPHTGGGLDLRPRDMARFGLLYLQGGRWGERQVVPAEWVEVSTRSHVDRNRGHSIGYGYLWWIHEPDPDGAGEQWIYAAQGFMGQYIFVVPEHRMVVVVTGGTKRYSDEIRPIAMLYDRILPAVRRTDEGRGAERGAVGRASIRPARPGHRGPAGPS